MPRLNRKILLESEISILPKRQKKWTIRAAAVFPGTYKAGMSNLGFLTLFQKMHDLYQFFPQRFFSDFGPYSLEENEPLKSFSLIAASISYELDYINFIKILLIEHSVTQPFSLRNITSAQSAGFEENSLLKS